MQKLELKNLYIFIAFSFSPGIDDAESECGLDEGVRWDFIVNNNGNDSELTDDIDKLINFIAS